MTSTTHTSTAPATGGRHRADVTREINGRRMVWLGIEAISLHAIDHVVPEPTSLSVGLNEITIHVRPGDRQTWIESIHVDRHSTIPTSFTGDILHSAHGRLPGLGVRVSVVSAHPAGEPVDLYVGEARQ